MVKQGIKNYFSSLKHFFTPLGTMFLGMMIGFSILFPGIFAATRTLVQGIKDLSQGMSLDLGLLFGDIWSSVLTLNWEDPTAALQTIFSTDWLRNVLTEELQAVLGTDFETFKAEVIALVADFTSAIIANVIMFFVCWILGFIAGFWLVRFLIRRDIAKRSLWKWLLTTFLNSFFTAGFVVAAAALRSVWGWSLILSVVLFIVIVGVIALMEAYLVHGSGKVPLKSIVNAKNVGLYALTDLFIFLISIALTVVACLVNVLMGVFVGLSLIVIALIVIDLNAESYVKSVAEGAVPAAKAAKE